MGEFSTSRTSKFDRLFKALVRAHVPVVGKFREMLDILETDPHNLSRQYKIKKLVDMDDGCWRLSVGVYRIRYDIEGKVVKLKSIRHRRDSYRHTS